MRYFDAHNHLQDERLLAQVDGLAQELLQLGLVEAVVAGSGVEDWATVAQLAQRYSWIRPSFGVHPWYVREQPADWLPQLRHWLLQFPNAGLGEAGLDRWIADPDVPLQQAMLWAQLELAVELERPVTLHCLRAFGLLEEMLKSCTRPQRGVLLHSYGGPVEMLPSWQKMGCYFSVSPYFLHPRKAAQWQTFAEVPLDRLLIETDAPDMWPPDELNPRAMLDSGGKPMNHPGNLDLLCHHLAKLRQMPEAELAEQLEANHRRLFGRDM
jgi:TatD DNase family protein